MKKSILIACLCCFAGTSISSGEELTVDSAIDRLLNDAPRGKIVSGEREVAEAKYNAERLGYIVPQISLSANTPYSSREDYTNYGGFSEPFLAERTSANATGTINLTQKVPTGADVSLSASMNLLRDEYPGSNRLTITDKRRIGNFRLEFTQPIFRTSDSRSQYLVARDNSTKADVQYKIDRVELKKEGITAYFDLLAARVDLDIAESERDKAAYTAYWDSVKFEDGVLNEDAYLESVADRLEKNLAAYDAQTTLEEKEITLRHLLGYPEGTELHLDVPDPQSPPSAKERHSYLSLADKSAETELARINTEIAERELENSRSETGLNGTLSANLSQGRGRVEQTGSISGDFEDRIETNGWGVSVNLNYPLWDGGASGANNHSLQLAYESAQLTYEQEKRNARNRTSVLLRKMEINYSKLSLLRQEIDLSERKYGEAQQRFEDGIINNGTLLENKIYWLTARKDYLTTLRDYLIDLTELEKLPVS